MKMFSCGFWPVRGLTATISWTCGRKLTHAFARVPDAKTGKLPAVGNTVNPQTAHYENTIGAAELRTLWMDPEFDAGHSAAYYLRVLEIPTPRWNTLLAAQSGVPAPKQAPVAVQQRGWSSPIWYSAHTEMK